MDDERDLSHEEQEGRELQEALDMRDHFDSLGY